MDSKRLAEIADVMEDRGLTRVRVCQVHLVVIRFIHRTAQ